MFEMMKLFSISYGYLPPNNLRDKFDCIMAAITNVERNTGVAFSSFKVPRLVRYHQRGYPKRAVVSALPWQFLMPPLPYFWRRTLPWLSLSPSPPPSLPSSRTHPAPASSSSSLKWFRL
ncbi:hypothetical protein NE237_009539 [Protea cynaroides]|uniref:Uncharacterized protein n=1 Tax=Protea cynaroides TaxID=273540 RepID=A0A9Q0KYS0_9MAGN|nr:hypothetical protein NE237_009539 [Protea cynaroides]